MSADLDALRRDVSLFDLAAGYGVKLTKDGAEYVACCPFHAEDTPSFTLFTGRDKVQRFHCFGCGQHGDVLDFVQGIKGVGLKDAIRILGGGKVGPNIAPRKIEARDVYDGIEPAPPAGEIGHRQKVTLYNPKRAGTEREWGSFTPSMVFFRTGMLTARCSDTCCATTCQTAARKHPWSCGFGSLAGASAGLGSLFRSRALSMVSIPSETPGR
ncbi:CHC2 zinc finger domain-containing protein [Xanthobacter oligotrophicus]|uniref:CHC2 zinc finger domain-containing protein n=1 Tax=Xanthobacter oligotrophicus TaxID=2607286 RepID=UPI0011F17B70|nr:CHC2 zinc finger domain-containing protein [Xanthobacter oligotrophicus]MCG5237123.1 CHC2 zinc finger domain-containing protein [Xanthobacter oligotrophicus]